VSQYQLFDSLQDIVLIIDDQTHVVYGNHAAGALFETSARRLGAGKPLSQFVTITENISDSFLSDAAELASITESTQVKELEFSIASGKAGWVQVSVQLLPGFFAAMEASAEPAAARWIIFMRDVTLEKTLHDKYRAELDKKEAVIGDLQIARAKLQDYSHNLENMVESRTLQLQQANGLLKTILDSLGQGILVFDEQGHCLPIFSKVCATIFGCEPVGQHIDRVLEFDESESQSFAKWRQAVFSEMLDFSDLVPLAPSQLGHQVGREIQFSYNPMRDLENKIQGVVLVATDRTREMNAVREAAAERDLVRRVVQVAKNRDSFAHFVVDARRLLNQLRAVTLADCELDASGLLNSLHTLKGGSSSFNLGRVAALVHELEEMINRLQKQAQATESGSDETTSRYAALHAHLLKETGLISEQLESDILQLSDLLGAFGTRDLELIEIPRSKLRAWGKALLRASSTSEVRQMTERFLKETFERPIGAPIEAFQSVVEDLSVRLGKQIEKIEIQGGDLLVPIEPLRPLLATLVHAVRNSIDHGIELPSVRAQFGKNPTGMIKIAFEKVTDQDFGTELLIEVSDDGAGIDPAVIRAKLEKQGLNQLAQQSDQEVIQAIFLSEFSTAQETSDISGRGVGMSAIAEETEKLGGSVQVASVLGSGIKIHIRVPMGAGFQTGFRAA
jgi:two-component system chemotaxis sensor kinase CheA